MDFEPVVRGIYLEGLIADEKVVWVTDPILGGIRRISADGEVRAYLPEKRWVGGLLLNADGRLLISGEGGIIWLDGETGATGVLVDQAEGKPLLGVNEMIADKGGAIYFGSLDAPAIAQGRAPGPASIYRMELDGRVREVRGGLQFSNGITLSPDGGRLYHSETFVGVSGYEVLPGGDLSDPVFFFDKPDADGMAVDADGLVWVVGFATDAIVRLTPEGKEKDRLPFPPGGATNVRFGGPDRRDLYLTHVAAGAADRLKAGDWPTVEESTLFRTRSPVAGLDYRFANFTGLA